MHYTVERRIKGQHDWTDKASVPSNSCLVGNLVKDTEYVFRVCAVNSAGMESDPSKVSEGFVARDVLRE